LISNPQKPDEGSVVFFDGNCGLCHGAVRFIARRDPRRRFRFAPLQSARGQSLSESLGLDPDQPDSLILEQGYGAYLRSEAALRIAAGLRFPWPALGMLRVLPRSLRDRLYDFVARRRLRWFGTADLCDLRDQADVAGRLIE
jgi:predicted DCC family thiol-disulfide oxidoreductase YuxK